MKYQLDTDFVVLHDCVSRPLGWRRQLADFCCRWLGHSLWRPGSVVVGALAGGSLEVNASYCRRCFVGGYVRGDYAVLRPAPAAIVEVDVNAIVSKVVERIASEARQLPIRKRRK